MQTPFERLAAVLDNASANYLSEQQRQQQLADQRQYAAQQLADQRQYAEGLTNKNRAYEQEAALVKAGYLSKPVGQNTPEEIAAGAGLAAQHALAIRNEEESTRKDTAAKRAHDAKQREREEQGWALNPLKSDERKAMEAAVDGGMINFGKPASKMTDEELVQANAEVKADAIKRAERGTQYATSIEQEIQQVRALTDPTPTAKELAQANANPPKSSSIADRQAATQAAQQMAAQAALQRAALAKVRLRDLSDTRDALIRSKQFPNEMPAPAALGTAGTEETPPPPPPPPLPPAAALGIDAETERDRITEEVDKAWPDIERDYAIAALGDDAIRERINKKKVMRTQVSSAPLSPETSYFVDPSKAEVDRRRIDLRGEQKAARGRLAKRRSQFEQYAPKDEARAKLAQAALALIGAEETVKQNAFDSVASKQ